MNHIANQIKIWVDKESVFYNKSIKSFLKNNGIEMHSTHNEEKAVVAERFIGTLKNKIYSYMTSISKNVYIDKIDNVVNKCNNSYYNTNKMKPVDLKKKAYIDSNKEVNNKDSKFKIGDIVGILKYKYIFVKCYTPNWLRKFKNTVLWTP